MTAPAALEILNDVFGYPSFRGRQAEIVETLAGGNSLLVLMPTGGGKSLCYQIPALMRGGVAVVVSPLIALMDDQVAALQAAGVAAASVHSGIGSNQVQQIADTIEAGYLKLQTPLRPAAKAGHIVKAAARPSSPPCPKTSSSSPPRGSATA